MDSVNPNDPYLQHPNTDLLYERRQ